METSKIYKSNYPDCLFNTKDLQLGLINLQYQGLDDFPSLLTIYEFEKPATQAYLEISNVIDELKTSSLSGYAIKGLFSLSIAYFETMLLDLIKKQLQFFPQKITSMKVKNDAFQKEVFISPKMINKGSILNVLIENEIQKLSYTDVKNQLSILCNMLSITVSKATTAIDNLIEIKESRNLLLHNNLYINEFYLTKTKSVKRGEKIGQLLSIDSEYAIKSLELISDIVEDIIKEIREKFGERTLLKMLQDLWHYTFKNRMIQFGEFAHLNFDKDIYDGPFNEPTFLSSSEKIYMEFWKAQRTNSPLNTASMVRLDSGTKLAFLVSVFGELRLPHW